MKKLVTDFIDKDLKKLERKNSREFDELSIQLLQLEASGSYYSAKPERQFLGIGTKHYRVLYKIEQDYIVCLVFLKKQGQKIENRHYDVAEARYKDFCKQLEEWENGTGR